MVDIQFIRDNPTIVKEKAKQKGYDIDIDKLLELDNDRKKLLNKVELLRQKRNNTSSLMKAGRPEASLIEKGKKIKLDLANQEKLLNIIEEEWNKLLNSVPNIQFDDVPIGGEDACVEIKSFGTKLTGALDHLDFALDKEWIDFDRGAKVAGTKFYYLKGDLALLELAIYQFALNFVLSKGFMFISVPNMVNSRIATGTGFAPRSSKQNDEYFIEGEDLSLIATAEIPITGFHADEIINEEKLPLLYTAYSPCYRKEAGTYGKHNRGLFRVHQFNKLEMYALTLPEDSKSMHQKILKTEEEIWQAIGIPYRVVNIASGDLGAPAAKKYDIEYWSKVDGKYRELTSASNCTDFQARNLNIRVKRKNGKIELVHSLNGTAVSLARALVAIIENFQNNKGELIVPKVLRPYLNGREIL